jgi:hypothetical protein
VGGENLRRVVAWPCTVKINVAWLYAPAMGLHHLKEYIRRAHPQWVAEYIEGREAAHRQARHADALDDLCRDVVRRSNCVYRTATTSKYSSSEITKITKDFAAQFWSQHATASPGTFFVLLHTTTSLSKNRNLLDLESILNVDETGVYYDSPPKSTWTHRNNDTAAIKDAEKHSARITAVLTVRMECTHTADRVRLIFYDMHAHTCRNQAAHYVYHTGGRWRPDRGGRACDLSKWPSVLCTAKSLDGPSSLGRLHGGNSGVAETYF